MRFIIAGKIAPFELRCRSSPLGQIASDYWLARTKILTHLLLYFASVALARLFILHLQSERWSLKKCSPQIAKALDNISAEKAPVNVSFNSR
jgi:hypothetical protein